MHVFIQLLKLNLRGFQPVHGSVQLLKLNLRVVQPVHGSVQLLELNSRVTCGWVDAQVEGGCSAAPGCMHVRLSMRLPILIRPAQPCFCCNPKLYGAADALHPGSCGMLVWLPQTQHVVPDAALGAGLCAATPGHP